MNDDSIYSVYVHVNKINQMKYVGCTKQTPPSKRWGKDGSGYRKGQEKFYKAIQEFGWDNFDHIILQDHLLQSEAYELEEQLIKRFNSIEAGYNAAYGGKDNKLSDESKEKLRQKRCGALNPNYNPNKKEYINTKSKLGFDGRKSIGFSKLQSALKTGAGNPNFGKHSWCYGKKMTSEQTQKMKEAYTEERKELVRLRHLGAKNPQAKAVICLTTNKRYETIIEAARETNVSERSVSDCCNGRIKSVKKLVFAFESEVMKNDLS